MDQLREKIVNNSENAIAVAIFVVVCFVFAKIIGRFLSSRIRNWHAIHTAENVVRLEQKPREKHQYFWPSFLRFPKVHPLVWLLGVAVLVNAYFIFFDETALPGARILNGRVTHVRDGDTIEVTGTPIRFSKLDCAELGTIAGERAKRHMNELVNGQRVECRLTGWRSYDRMIGECNLADGRNLSEVMIEDGLCGRWW